jgi:shikimate kinase
MNDHDPILNSSMGNAASHQRRNLVLIGFMGTGKSTVGRRCARRLGYTFTDSDRVIEEQAGCTIPELFAAEGEAAFRERERAVIAELAATPGLVIATGGGAILNPENVANLRATGFVVLLTATPDALLQRVGHRRNRPLLASAPDPRARIVELLSAREPLYRQAAHHIIDTTELVLEGVVEEVVWLFGEESGVREEECS